MSKELDEELARGNAAAEALIQHMQDMGGASELTIPINYVTRGGWLEEWLITVELKTTNFKETPDDLP